MRILSIGCLLMLALAGCTDEANEPESPDVVMDDTPSQNNTAPAPQLDADIVNGTAPLLVNFTITATDVDGDNLTWVFEAHANGTMVANATGNQSAFPAQVNATFEANGTATLTVSDGTNSTTVSVNITATAAAGAAVEDADAVDPNTPEDRGAFIFYPETGECHYKEYDNYGDTLYQFDLWLFAEDNGVPGLQVANTFPGPEGQGFESPDWVDCQNGDLILF